MRKLIILVLLVILSCGLYFHHQDNWGQKREEINAFKEKIAKGNLKESHKIKISPKNESQVSDSDVELKSPFNSKLAVAMATKLAEDRVKEVKNNNEVKEKIEKKQKIEIQRPDFDLKGIVIIGEYRRVNIEFAGDYKRLSKGQEIDRFTLVDISRNSATFKKGESYFEFRIDDRD
ncbi:hypothetical protein BX659_11943 [Orenia metallireducens]|uniref:Uncharacterized protein n=1 Tax=Orenia metallireducens TaxID=1413210 RepID=A0A285HK00_9FIRM|nr:hypothetical protein [Orenia metallireducens]PRX26679.1 hypothetical protein BX659_11943 [Orenia metallireducens]SNY36058.1 hypothetical protein SAMN06265827_12043 [Orenia metallireducens]